MITGGLGFIGSHLVDSLYKKNHEIMMNDKFDIIHAIGVRSFQAFIAALVSKY